MANRRMFSSRIINSGKFLQMSQSAQALYFHLGMRADDDGIVEAYSVMNLMNAAEDDFKVLVAKGFIKPLNEELVSYIVDWNEHNVIRADRKVNSIYKELLVKMMPDVEVVQPKPRSDVENNSRRLDPPTPALEAEEVKTKVAKFTDLDMGMAKLLHDLIKKNTPEWNITSTLESWAVDINKLHRIDGRTYDQITFMIKWVQRDPFWSANILSAKKLREKFSDLIPRIKAGQNKTKDKISNIVVS